MPLGGAVFFAGLVLAGADVFVGAILIARALADPFADRSMFAGLNVGSILGLALLSAAALRILSTKRPRGLVAVAVVALLFVASATVAYAHVGFDKDVTKELIRNISILAVALVALNASNPRVSARIPTAVVLASLAPALIALYQLATGVGYEGSRRVYATLSHPNSAGALFAVAFSVALWKYLEDGRSGPYLLAAVALALALLATQSFGALGQVVISVLVFAFIVYRRTPKMAVLVGAAVLLVFVFATSSLGRQRVEQIRATRSVALAADPNTVPLNSLEWRLGHWVKEFHQWEQQPLLGWGLGATLSFRMVDGFVAHDDLIRLLVEAGVIGFAVFGWAFIRLFVRLNEAAKADRSSSFAAASIAILAGLFVNSLANDVSLQTVVMYAAAAVVGCALTRAPQVSARSG